MTRPTPPLPPTRSPHAAATVRDLRGGARLAIDGLQAAIGRLEDVHARLAEVSPPVRGARPGRPGRGWPAVVYRGLRGGTDLLGGGLDLALASAQAMLQSPQRAPGPAAPRPTRESLVAALNALAGDHLHRTDNPLHQPVELHQRHAAARPRVLVLVHDLGLGAFQWNRAGHDHGEALAAALDVTPLYAAYNSGRHAWASGRELAAAIEQQLARWPVPLEGLALLGHGLGGLVLRSALHQAVRSGLAWPAHLRHLLLLGTPLAGAQDAGGLSPFRLAGLGPQAALGPLARLSGRRSEGFEDFLAGRYLEPEAAGAAAPTLTSMPPGARAFAIAGDDDAFVAPASALGLVGTAAAGLDLTDDRRWTAAGVDHAGLLASRAVADTLRGWLAS